MTIATDSHKLLGRAHRLRLLAVIADWPTDSFTTTALAQDLGMTTGEVSRELKVFAEVGLVEPGQRQGERPYRRVPSAFWKGCFGLFREWTDREAPEPGDSRIVRLRRE